MDRTFEMNGKSYATDKATLEVLRLIIPSAKSSKDFSAVSAVMTLGQHAGRIRELA